jgi:hypothetical protein
MAIVASTVLPVSAPVIEGVSELHADTAAKASPTPNQTRNRPLRPKAGTDDDLLVLAVKITVQQRRR